MRLFFSVVLLFSILSQNLYAQQNQDVHQKLFILLRTIYIDQVDSNFCELMTEDCALVIKGVECKRNNNCFVSFIDNDSNVKDITINHSHRLNLSLYITLRKASAVNIANIMRFGPRFRPHFKSERPFVCNRHSKSKSFECI